MIPKHCPNPEFSLLRTLNALVLKPATVIG